MYKKLKEEERIYEEIDKTEMMIALEKLHGKSELAYNHSEKNVKKPNKSILKKEVSKTSNSKMENLNIYSLYKMGALI